MGVATAMAIGGLAISAASSAKSFADAAKQKKAQKEAEAAGAAAMAAARKKLDVNMYESLGINKEAYELAQNTMLAQGAQATEAARESERGVAATAGAVQQAVNEGAAGLRTQMGTELMDIQKTIAGEEANLQKLRANLDVGEAEGAQQAAADAQRASAAAMAQGFQSATSALQQGAEMVPLFQKTPSSRAAAQIDSTAMGKKYGLSQTDLQKSIGAMGTVNGVDLSRASSLSPSQYQDFMGGLDVNTLRAVQQKLPTGLSSFMPGYTPPTLGTQAALPLPPALQYGYNIPGLGG
jgi:hypothetical protein